MSSYYLSTDAGRRKLQTALAEHGFQPGPVDGILGPATSRAIINARIAYKLSHQDQAELDVDLERHLGLLAIQDPAVKAVGTAAFEILIRAMLPSFLKGLPDMSALFAGYKTFLLGGVTIAVGLLALLGWDIPGFQHIPGGATIDAGLAMIFLRLGIKNAFTDLAEKIIGGLGK